MARRRNTSKTAPGSSQMSIGLGSPGAWTIRVNNPDGGHSNTFTFNVK